MVLRMVWAAVCLGKLLLRVTKRQESSCDPQTSSDKVINSNCDLASQAIVCAIHFKVLERMVASTALKYFKTFFTHKYFQSLCRCGILKTKLGILTAAEQAIR